GSTAPAPPSSWPPTTGTSSTGPGAGWWSSWPARWFAMTPAARTGWTGDGRAVHRVRGLAEAAPQHAHDADDDHPNRRGAGNDRRQHDSGHDGVDETGKIRLRQRVPRVRRQVDLARGPRLHGGVRSDPCATRIDRRGRLGRVQGPGG